MAISERFKMPSLELALALVLAFVSAVGHCATNDKEDALTGFRDFRAQNQRRLEDVDQKIRRSLDDQLRPQLTSNLNIKDLENLKNQRQELLARQQFLDRLILQIDSKYRGGDMRRFLQERLSDMAQVDLLSADAGHDALWKQMTYLSQALRDLPERDENLVSFVSGYLAASSFKDPLKPEDYLKTRNFTNGRTSIAAAPVKAEDVGEAVEKRLDQIEKSSEKTQQ